MIAALEIGDNLTAVLILIVVVCIVAFMFWIDRRYE